MKSFSKSQWITVGVALIIGLLFGWLVLGNNHSTDEAAISADTHNHESAEQIWTCSMHPQIRQNEPGDCPICGMDLVPLTADLQQNDNIPADAIQMSATARELAKVETAVVKPITANSKSIHLTGKLQTPDKNVLTQAAHMGGRIESLAISNIGDKVNAGDILATIYSPELANAQQELAAARQYKESNPAIYKAAVNKLKNWKLTDKQIEQLVNSSEPMRSFDVLANQSGIVTQKMVTEGEYVKKGQPLFELTDYTTIWAVLDVYEKDLNFVNEGDQVHFTVDAFPSKNYDGVISYIEPTINALTRVAQARVELKNRQALLKPEMLITGVLSNATLSQEADIQLSIPKSAVLWTGKRSVVYVEKQTDTDTYFEMRKVSLGAEVDGVYIIKEGLREGEKVATQGAFSIDAAAQLAGKHSMMNPKEEVLLSGNATEEWNKVTLAYLSLKDHLVNDAFADAKKAAMQLKAELKESPALSEQKEWQTQLKQITQHLQHTHHAENIEDLRNAFIPISDAFIHFAQLAGSANHQIIYVQHCPMADSNKGAYWLSLEKEIRNPYFGASMLSCGSVTKEIN